MPDLIRFSDLKDSHPLTLDGNNDLFAIAVKNPSSETGYTSQTVLPNQIAGYVAEDATYVNLKTGASDNTVVKAINKTLENFADEFNTTVGSTYAKDDCVIYDGILYQCTNVNGTTSGTFVTADWTQVKAVDVGAGGGGGGGHTILDDEGTSLTQRSKLQFKGAYSEDNSTDSTTEVNVVRSMTKAEFDLLSSDEKVGIINITDVTGGAEDKFQPIIYSETEREIGVWTDGKPLYEKTIILRENSVDKYTITGAIGTGALYDVGLTGLDKIYITGLYAKRGSAGNTVYTDIAPSGADVVVVFKHSDGSIYFRDTFDPTDIIVTIRYTKSTDQAGSGQWTPQGVPAVHYSTDEQVVGTWIDGSTLYEKTLHWTGTCNSHGGSAVLDNTLFRDNVNYFAVVLSCVKSNDLENNIYSYTLGGDALEYTINNQHGVLIENYSGYAIHQVDLTIRYTKSST